MTDCHEMLYGQMTLHPAIGDAEPKTFAFSNQYLLTTVNFVININTKKKSEDTKTSMEIWETELQIITKIGSMDLNLLVKLTCDKLRSRNGM